VTNIQRLILEDDDTTYEVLVETVAPVRPTTQADGGYESYGPSTPKSPGYPEPTRVELKKVHDTIRGYTEYAIGAFKNLAVANVEELNLKFKLKISTEGGIPMLASGKTEADFEIEVKCKFPDKSNSSST
jgi:hypothetical protein